MATRAWAAERKARCSRASKTKLGQARVSIRARAQGPVELALRFGDGQVVDAGEAPFPEPLVVELPGLVAARPEPVTARVMPLVRAADGQPAVVERPHFPDRPEVLFRLPFAGQKPQDLGATPYPLGPVSPAAIRRVIERNAFRIAAVPRVLGQTHLLRGKVAGEEWEDGHGLLPSLCDRDQMTVTTCFVNRDTRWQTPSARSASAHRP